ncbi:hypothetical protein TD95_002380 [Thielaviopsis punctulata]|uniref:Cullin family profile domain-containing protein n=1 Tax=Thielaviopsis punctulata TaxID=72032 RepID=A0A0F4ZFM7_9PEZI|nr:hypothetical protein TD95_002380 [Thielaviopsis punctulata]
MASNPHSFQPLTGARKLVIKNRRDPAAAQQKVQEYFDRTWAELSTATNALLYGELLVTPLDRLCRGVEAICRDGQAESLFKKLSEHTQAFLTATLLKTMQGEDKERTNREILQAVVQNWNVWRERTKLVRSMFSYLDRAHLQRNTNTPGLNDMMTSQFRRIAFPSVTKSSSANKFDSQDGSFSAAVVTGICDLADHHRHDDGDFDAQLFKDSIAMLHSLGVYSKTFEPLYMYRASQYFSEVAARSQFCSLTEYLVASDALMHRESERCDLYGLDTGTRFRMLDRFFFIMVQWPLERINEGNALAELLAAQDLKTLKTLYLLFLGAKKAQVSDVLEQLDTQWRNYIVNTGSAILRDTAVQEAIIPEILVLKKAMQRVAQDAFGNNEMYVQSLREALGSFINDESNASKFKEGVSKIGELAAKYMDALLRIGVKAVPAKLLVDNQDQKHVAGTGDDDARLDYYLDQILQLFRLIQGKDAFEAFYKRDLARRLLMDRSLSHDAERLMLARLRSECGINFTHNLEGMFKDKEMNKDEMASFKTWCQKALEKPPVDTTVLVLSAASWPTYADVELTLDPAIQKSLDVFDEFYKSKHTGRVLSWKHGLGHCVLRANFAAGVKELNVSLLQASVLLAFNNTHTTQKHDSFLTYQQIEAHTQLNSDDLNRTLQSLACGKYRVLNKHPRGRDVHSTDTFTFNKGFTDAKYRIKINQIQMRETAADVEVVHERVVLDRRLETQAAIVRIMKSRKTLAHSVLVAEVINMMKTRGTVDPAAIKQEIELLLDRDYIEREGNEYVYIA